jgi:GAF domain-containing protein
MAAVLAMMARVDGSLDGTGASAMAAAAAALEVDGVSAGVGAGPQGLVLAWGREVVSVALDDLQFTLGQGPAVEAAAGALVLVPDLAAAATRWPAFVPAASELGVRALFALPLRIGAISVGVFVAHRSTPGPLRDGGLADALALADAVAILLLHLQSAASVPTAQEAAWPRENRGQPTTYRAEVHQAAGMISVQLDVDLAEALVRLRAYAYAEDRPIVEVAADVVARRLRFDDLDP